MFFHRLFQGAGGATIPAKREFIPVSSKSNIAAPATKNKIERAKKLFFPAESMVFYVIVCFDADSTSNSEKQINEGIIHWCEEHGYIPLVFSKNVEQVLGVPHEEASKKERAGIFAKTNKQYLKEAKYVDAMSCSLEQTLTGYHRSNFMPVLRRILDDFSK
ncbi:MAG: hypothetical protein IJ787_06970 [Bacilli bacterium]|nr:hypothetical protein [Bacilli bacterium]